MTSMLLIVSSDCLPAERIGSSLTHQLRLEAKVQSSSREAVVGRRKRRGTYQACTWDADYCNTSVTAIARQNPPDL